MGRYSVYLRPYIELFGKINVKIVFFEDLISDPKSVLHEISKFAEIDPNFYDNYIFKHYNATVRLRTSIISRFYSKMHYVTNKLTYNKPYLHALIKQLKYFVQPILFGLLKNKEKNGTIPEIIRNRLLEFYNEEKDILEELLGVPIPWYERY